MIDDLKYFYDDEGYNTEVTLINCHYPVTEDKFVLQFGIIVKKSEHLSAEAAQEVADKNIVGVGRGFREDIAIWSNKTRIDNPLLCEQDGPVYQLRRWYEQFYVDVADIEPEMVNRFEFEIDTTTANDAWHAEVAENLAKRDLVGTQTGQD